MSTLTEGYKKKEATTFIQTCIIMDKPVKHSLQRLAFLKHATVSHLVNLAAEEYLKRNVELQKEIMFQ